ncbi:MAG: hypothetical protein WB615_02640 [Candidatus Tumulicola sp.]
MASSASPAGHAFARVDLVQHNELPHVLEVEMIEPTLYLYSKYTIPTAQSEPIGIASSRKEIWFTEQAANKIGRLNPVTGRISEYTIPTSSSSPTQIAQGSDGAMWFTEQSGNKIGRISGSGTISEFTLPGQNSQPWGITKGARDRALWFTEWGTGKIARITRRGVITEYQASTTNLSDIAESGDGTFWFAETNCCKLGRISAKGVIREHTIRNPHYPESPVGVVVGPGGSVWYADFRNNEIGSYVP